MTLPKKGRRSVTVDHVEYHYLIAFKRSQRAVIQHASGIGAFLFVFPFAIMQPSNVANAIQFAKSCAWNPTLRGEACWLVFDVDASGNSHFEHIPRDDFRVVTYSSKGRIPDNIDTSKFADTRPWYARPRPSAHQN